MIIYHTAMNIYHTFVEEHFSFTADGCQVAHNMLRQWLTEHLGHVCVS